MQFVFLGTKFWSPRTFASIKKYFIESYQFQYVWKKKHYQDERQNCFTFEYLWMWIDFTCRISSRWSITLVLLSRICWECIVLGAPRFVRSTLDSAWSSRSTDLSTAVDRLENLSLQETRILPRSSLGKPRAHQLQCAHHTNIQLPRLSMIFSSQPSK